MRRGFSLVELSIVLVILGLLVGGILAGQSLIRAAELRSVSTDITRYQTAMYAFRDKYFALPGDMTNATSFWGFASGTTGLDNACYGTASTDARTCNGNGNGQIDYLTGANGLGEIHRFWQHLANAGFIEGRYSGQDVGCVPGTNCPSARITGTGFDVVWIVYGGAWGDTFSSANNGNLLFYGALDGIPRAPALRPEEAWNIDTKMDDGFPDSGTLQTGRLNGGPNCFTGAYPNAIYALSTTSTECSLRYSLK